MKNLLSLFFILITLIVSFNNSVEAKNIKFIQITDSHFSANGKDYTQREVANSETILDKTIQDVNTIKNVDFIVFTGDNIDTANIEDLKLFLQKANKLKRPYYIVIGNHEVFKSQNLTKEDYMQIVRKHSISHKPKSANYVFEKKGIIFIVVDGAKEIIPGPSGYYKKDTLTWLDKKLTKYKNKNVIIFQHFPIEAPYYNRSHSTYKVEDYKDVLKKHNNVIAIFSGHYHANGEIKKDGIYHVSTPSLVEIPYNYKIIDIFKKNKNNVQIYTQLRHAE